MISEIEVLGQILSDVGLGKITDCSVEKECKPYLGHNFKINGLNFKFRKAKITPKKVGQFVTLWKRNTSGITEPFNLQDNFDFYVIAVGEDQHSGFFIFPRIVLANNNILTTTNSEGKRGFRVYPDWTENLNKQAQKTFNWQNEFFIYSSQIDKIALLNVRQIFELS